MLVEGKDIHACIIQFLYPGLLQPVEYPVGKFKMTGLYSIMAVCLSWDDIQGPHTKNQGERVADGVLEVGLVVKVSAHFLLGDRSVSQTEASKRNTNIVHDSRLS